ncbi:MAG: glyoxalase-like domain protein [Acidobacteria bacterium]|nr:MAG: glyoxalase-like domain protein [Acidobacteriota bacterium]REK08815.1 MAG: glyoxalase-like domain protein [Acidobacteriota bacterium]
MSFEVDHVFVAASCGAPQAEDLVEAGFAEGPANHHPGQGTACRRFFFENAYLELAWLVDFAEASSREARRIGVRERVATESGASHAGICLRARDPTEPLPVDTWSYTPSYIPQGTAIPIAANSARLDEPLLFFLPAGLVPLKPEDVHPNGARRLSSVRLTLPQRLHLSSELTWLAQSGIVEVELAETESVSLVIDGGRVGDSVALDAAVPLELSW